MSETDELMQLMLLKQMTQKQSSAAPAIAGLVIAGGGLVALLYAWSAGLLPAPPCIVPGIPPGCVPGGGGGGGDPCGAGNPCPSGQVCVAGACYPATTCPTVPCPSGQTCVNGACVLDAQAQICVLSGATRTSGFQKVTDVQVDIYRPGEYVGDPDIYIGSANSGAEGTYSIELPWGYYKVVGTKDGYETYEVSPIDCNRPTKNLDIIMVQHLPSTHFGTAYLRDDTVVRKGAFSYHDNPTEYQFMIWDVRALAGVPSGATSQLDGATGSWCSGEGHSVFPGGPLGCSYPTKDAMRLSWAKMTTSQIAQLVDGSPPPSVLDTTIRGSTPDVHQFGCGKTMALSTVEVKPGEFIVLFAYDNCTKHGGHFVNVDLTATLEWEE